VSREVILRRLVLIGKASEEFYRKKRKEYLAAYAEEKERNKQKLKESGLQLPHFRMVLRNNGLSYTRIVLNAFYEGNITTSDLSDFLNVRLKHLSAIEQAVFSPSTGMVWQ